MSVVDRWLKRFLKDPPPERDDALLRAPLQDDARNVVVEPPPAIVEGHVRQDPLDENLARARARLTADAAGRAYADSGDFLVELQTLDGGGRGKAADALLADALLVTPSLALRRRLAERLLHRGDRARARGLLVKLSQSDEHATFALTALGEIAEAEGDVDEALRCYEQVLAKDVTLEQPKARARRLRAGREARRGKDDGRAMLARVLGARAAGARYAVLEEIGRGGAATVFRARDRVIDREVALKIFHPRGNAKERRARLVEEARIAGSFDHPHIVPILDLDAERDLLVMAMCDGGSLRQRLGHGKLRSGEAVELAAVLLRTLADIHDGGQVHLDIKPSNLLFHQQQLLVCDFGTAGLVELGAAAGTRAYMSPEQRQGGRVGKAADLYAAGLVAAEMLEGRLPSLDRGVRLPSLLPGPRTRALETVCSMLCATDPESRPSDGRRAAELLLEAGALPATDAEGTALYAHLKVLANREGEDASFRLSSHPLTASLRAGT